MSASYLARLAAAAAAAAFQLDAPRERQMTRPCGFPPRPAVPTFAVVLYSLRRRPTTLQLSRHLSPHNHLLSGRSAARRVKRGAFSDADTATTSAEMCLV